MLELDIARRRALAMCWGYISRPGREEELEKDKHGEEAEDAAEEEETESTRENGAEASWAHGAEEVLLSPEQLLEEASRIEEWEAVGDSRADFEFGGESAADTEAMVLALERDQRVSPKGCLGDFTTTKVRSNPKRVTCNCQIFNLRRDCPHCVYVEVLHWNKFPSGKLSLSTDKWDVTSDKLRKLIRVTSIS